MKTETLVRDFRDQREHASAFSRRHAPAMATTSRVVVVWSFVYSSKSKHLLTLVARWRNVAEAVK